PQFLLRKKIAAHLHEKFGNDFLPAYSMVSFSDTPYSVALAEGEAQDELLDRILELEEIEERWDWPEVDALFEAWRRRKNG
ncbi:hypothetical protein RZS08_25310, partial [Arthrospira platensis SPKY1]|nr:hypothetical protein [Arthrospira platensis SPKY1]